MDCIEEATSFGRFQSDQVSREVIQNAKTRMQDILWSTLMDFCHLELCELEPTVQRISCAERRYYEVRLRDLRRIYGDHVMPSGSSR